MLYIKGHKIIKGYVGNTPVSHVGFGKSGLIKIKSENGGSDYPNNLIAKYTANASGVLPIFNSGYQYTVNETKSNGVYIVEISSDSDFTSCNFSGKTQLLTVDYLKVTDKVISMENTFNGCKSLTKVNTSNFDTSNVTDMNYVFQNCQSLTSLDVSNWNTSKVTHLQSVFLGCTKLIELDVSNWNVSGTSNFHHIFNNCKALTHLDLSNWDVKNVTATYDMFNGCLSLVSLDLSGWNMNKVTDYSNMFTATSMLAHIIMTNSDYNSINKIIASLESKTSRYGLLDVTGVDDISLVDEETLNSKNWALSNVEH